MGSMVCLAYNIPFHAVDLKPDAYLEYNRKFACLAAGLSHSATCKCFVSNHLTLETFESVQNPRKSNRVKLSLQSSVNSMRGRLYTVDCGPWTGESRCQ